DAAMRRARGVIIEAYQDFNRVFNRDLTPFVDEYMTKDADVILVGMGTMAMPMRVAVRRLREQGQKVGFLRIKWMRPFPVEDVQRVLSRAKAVGVIDRDYSFGSPFYGGVLYNEIRSALYDMNPRVPLVGFIAGLGGREITQPFATEMFGIAQQVAKTGKSDNETHWIGVRGKKA
ncbi:MAG: pyruvate ferredoxin oxidoreductase, partial [Chloroflexota bacterium]